MGPSARNDGLDAIRLTAAMMVFAGHAALASGAGVDGPIVNGAGIGVALFFVLSGYLIPTVWARTPDRRYWIRRGARIIPAYLFATIGLAILTGVPLTLRDLTMTQDFGGKGFDTFMGVAWTLQLEIIFYALVPLLARLPLRWIAGAGAASLAVFVILYADEGIRQSFPARFWMFVPGIALARVGLPRLSPAVAGIGVALTVLACLVGSVPIGTAGAAALVGFALSRRLAMPRWVVYGSTISYGIYLWHHEIVRALRDAGLSPLAIVLGGLALTLVAAAASWHLLEEPLNRLAVRPWRGYAVRLNSIANSSAK